MNPARSKWQCYPPASLTEPIISWQPEPTFRGTLNIFTSCILTLFLCVWSASHVDIQAGKSTFGRFLAKCGWLLLALFWPQLLFYIAFKQFRVAVRLTLEGQNVLPIAGASRRRSRTMQVLAWVVGVRRVELFPPPPPPPPPADVELPEDMLLSDDQIKLEEMTSESPSDSGGDVTQAVPRRKHCWTLVHGFYAAMGGFVLNDPKIESQDHYLPAWQRNGVLTPMGVLFLMEHAPSLIPDLSSSDILERSKADGLAKILLVCQVLWFLFTCINRAVQGLPLCLLEITTIAHALCSLLTYALWWRKPKDVDHQTVIEGPNARPIGAWLSMKSEACRTLLGGLVCFHGKSEAYYRNPAGRPRDESGSDLEDHLDANNRQTFKKALLTRFVFRTTTTPWYIQGNRESQDESRARELRWALAYRAHQQYRPHASRGVRFVIPTPSLQAYATHTPAYPEDEDISVAAIIRNVSIIIVLGSVYGLPHLLGSTVIFESAKERTIWFVGTALVAAMGRGSLIVLSLQRIFLAFLDMLLLYFTGEDPRFCERWSRQSFRAASVVIAIVYVCSSGYLVGESLRQLFALPPDAFSLPSWGNYWPHFS